MKAACLLRWDSNLHRPTSASQPRQQLLVSIPAPAVLLGMLPLPWLRHPQGSRGLIGLPVFWML